VFFSNSVAKIVPNNLPNISTTVVDGSVVFESSGLVNGEVRRIGNEFL
jgi:hypothetical protein